MAAKPIRIAIIANASQAKKELNSFSDGLGSKFKKAGLIAAAGAAVAGAAIAKFGSDSVKAASDLKETVSKTQTVFGKQSPAILAWGKSAATALGMSQQAALDGASTFGNFFDQIGIGKKQSAEMSQTWVKMAADLGSFHNAAPTEVMDALAAATRGEYDSLQKFIPTINAAAVEQEALAETGKKNAKQLTASEKAAATYTLTLKGQGKAAGDFARTQDSAANKQKILAAQMDNLKAKIGTALLPVWEKLLGVVSKVVGWIGKNAPGALDAMKKKFDAVVTAMQPFLDKAKEIFDRLGGWPGIFERAKSAVQGIVSVMSNPAVQAFAAAILAIVVAVNVYSVTMKAVAAVTRAWAAAQAALNVVMSMNPIGLIVLAIVGLVAAFVVAYKRSEKFRSVVDGAMSGVKKAFDKFLGAVRSVFGWVTSNWGKILAVLTGPIGIAVALIVKNWDKIKSATSAVWNAIKSALSTVWNWIKSTVSAVWNGIKSVTSTVWNGIKSVLSAVWNGIKSAATAAWNAIKSAIGAVWNGIKTVVTTAVNVVKTVISKVWNTIKSAASTVWNGIKSVISGVWGGIKAVVSAAIDHVKGILTNAWNTIQQVVHKAWDGIKSAVSTGISNVVSTVKGVPGKVKSALGSLASTLYNAGTELIQGLINGIKAMLGKVGDAMSSVASKIKGFLPGSPVKEGPLVSWNNGGAGKKLMKLLEQGIKDGSDGVTKAVEGVTKRMNDVLEQQYKAKQKSIRKNYSGKDEEKRLAKLEKTWKKHVKAVNKATKDEREALVKNGKAQDVVAEKLAAARDKLAELRQQSADFAKGVKDSIVAFGDITNLGRNEDGTVTLKNLLGQLKTRVAQAKQFSKLMQDLAKQGLSDTALQQILAAGPEAGLATAQAIASGGKAAIDEINKGTAELASVGGGLGKAMSKEFFQAGIDAAVGLVKGLESQAKALDKEAVRLADALVKAVKKALGIKSPSKEMMKIMDQTVAGLEVKTDHTRFVDKQGMALASSLTDGFGEPALNAWAEASATQDNSIKVRLTAQQVSQLERGREIAIDLDAYYAAGGRRRAA